MQTIIEEVGLALVLLVTGTVFIGFLAELIQMVSTMV